MPTVTVRPGHPSAKSMPFGREGGKHPWVLHLGCSYLRQHPFVINHSFIPQTFIGSLLCAKHCSSPSVQTIALTKLGRRTRIHMISNRTVYHIRGAEKSREGHRGPWQRCWGECDVEASVVDETGTKPLRRKEPERRVSEGHTPGRGSGQCKRPEARLCLDLQGPAGARLLEGEPHRRSHTELPSQSDFGSWSE